MKKIMKETAWMLRWGDCVALPVLVHPYIYEDDMEESFSGIQWLLENSLHASHFWDLALDAIRTWASLEYNCAEENMAEDLSRIFSDYGPEEPRLSEAFIRANAPALTQANDDADIFQNLALLKELLNDEFLRVRFGGLVDTRDDSAELVFRPSSSGKDWAEKIASFLKDFGRAESVTIIRDTEPFSNAPMRFYKSDSGKFYDQMPVDVFGRQPGALFVRQETAFGKLLENHPLAELLREYPDREELLRLKEIANEQERQFVKNHPIAMVRAELTL